MKIRSRSLLNTHIYKTIIGWLNKSDLTKLETSIADLSIKDKFDIRKNLLKKDFFTTFLIICDISYSYITDPDSKKDTVKDIIGSVFGRLIFETESIPELNKIINEFYSNKGFARSFKSWIEDRRNGHIWIENTRIDELIDHYFENRVAIRKEIIIGDSAKGMTRSEYAVYEMAMMTGSSYMDIESMLARGISRTSLCNIFYSYLMIKQLIDGLDEDFYLTWYEDNDLFKGSSGVNHFFDGMILLNDEDTSEPWLLKCVTTSHNPLDAIECLSSTLDDISLGKCIIFLPTYPSQNAMRYSVHAYANYNQEVIILYLQDLYTMLRFNIDNDKEEIRTYLESRRIGS